MRSWPSSELTPPPRPPSPKHTGGSGARWRHWNRSQTARGRRHWRSLPMPWCSVPRRGLPVLVRHLWRLSTGTGNSDTRLGRSRYRSGMTIHSVLFIVIAVTVGVIGGWVFTATYADRLIAIAGRRHVSHGMARCGAPSPRFSRTGAAVVTASACGLLAMRLGPSLDALIPLGLVLMGTALAQTDIAVQRLPNSAVGVTTVVTTTLLLIARIAGVAPERVTAAALGAVAMGVLYLIPAVLSPPSMGMGDVKLAVPLGLVVGWFGIYTWLLSIAIATTLAGTTGVIIVLSRILTVEALSPVGSENSRIPLAPFMLVGGLCAIVIVP